MTTHRRLNELEKEKEQLRQQLQISRHRPTNHPAIAPVLPAARMGVPIGPTSRAGSDASQSLAPRPDHPLALADSSTSEMAQGNSPTSSRSLKGVKVTGEEIDDMYQMYMLSVNISPHLASNRHQILPSLCLICSNSRSPSQARRLLCAVTIPFLGRYRCLQSVISPQPDPANGIGPGDHRNGVLVSSVHLFAMVYDSRPVAIVNLAIPERKSTRCHISFEWDVATRGNAERVSYSHVESRILQSEDSSAIGTRHDSSVRTLGSLCPGIPTVSLKSQQV